MTYTRPVYVIEVDAVEPGAAVVSDGYSWGAAPWGALAEFADDLGATTVITASDLGYRTRDSDPLGVVPYPPHVADAFQITRAMNLAPNTSGVAAAWGSAALSNTGGRFNDIVDAFNNDGRGVRIYRGVQTYEAPDMPGGRGVWTDPPYAALVSVFQGIATPWQLSETQLSVPLRDATYWLEQPIQTNLYGGTGGYDGTADLAGAPKPKTRGRVFGVTPTLVDPVALIYQYSDAAGSVTTLWEGRKATYTFAGNTTDLYTGSTPAGQYRTDNSRGLFQLGTAPTYNITLDCAGNFPLAGFQAPATSIARYLLAEDIAVPPAYLDTASFAIMLALTGGVYFASTETPDGATAVARALAGLNISLVPKRDGRLALVELKALTGTETPVKVLDTSTMVSVTPRALPAAVDPQPYRIRIGYQHNYTVQTSGLNPTATASSQTFARFADRFATWINTATLTAYARPNDPPPVVTCLDTQANAQTVANRWGALWGVRRRLYDVVLPLSIGLTLEFGDVIYLTWPVDDLRWGQFAIVVGDEWRSTDPTIKVTVLV